MFDQFIRALAAACYWHGKAWYPPAQDRKLMDRRRGIIS